MLTISNYIKFPIIDLFTSKLKNIFYVNFGNKYINKNKCKAFLKKQQTAILQ